MNIAKPLSSALATKHESQPDDRRGKAFIMPDKWSVADEAFDHLMIAGHRKT